MSVRTPPSVNVSVARQSDTFQWQGWILWLPTLAALAYLLWDLQYWWSKNEDYNFGWIVPAFSAYLVYENWSLITSEKKPDVRWYIPAWILASVCFGVVSLYKSLIGPDQTPSWILSLGTLAVVSATILASWGWRALRLCLFPLLFLLVAVPLPQSIWGGISQSLQRVVASLSVEILGFMNIPVFQQGNTLELVTGHLSIADACSGIRSLQLSIMLGLLLGKLFLKTYIMRGVLVLLGMMVAFPGNLFRTVFLTYIAHHDGMEAMRAIHDLLGWIVMGLIVLGVTVICAVLYHTEKSAVSQQTHN